MGVKEKVLGIEPRKILRPDPSLYSQYFPSYDIFGEPQSDTQFSTAGFAQKQGYHKKWHNSESIVSTDLGQVSKFSLIRYLELFL